MILIIGDSTRTCTDERTIVMVRTHMHLGKSSSVRKIWVTLILGSGVCKAVKNSMPATFPVLLCGVAHASLSLQFHWLQFGFIEIKLVGSIRL
jgi:hypothetical protein